MTLDSGALVVLLAVAAQSLGAGIWAGKITATLKALGARLDEHIDQHDRRKERRT
jgi:hypothetical protein